MTIDPAAGSSGSKGRLKSPQYAAASRQACRSRVPIRMIGDSTRPSAAAYRTARPAASRALIANAGVAARTSLAKRCFIGCFALLIRFRQQLSQRIERLPRKTLERIVLRDDGHSPFIVADFKKSQQVADIILIVKLCTDAHCQALHRE